MLEAIILTVITAATPLLLAAIGELVVEKSGVLNLRVAGVMGRGGVAGLAVTISSGRPLLGSVGGVVLAFLLQFIQTISISFPAARFKSPLALYLERSGDSSSAMLDTFLQTSSCFIAQESLATDWINCFPKVEPKPHAFAF